MENYKNKNQFCSILIFVENCLYYDAIPDFLVLLRTGSNPVDVERFGSYTKKKILKKL